MRAVVDSSAWISLARSGLLPVLTIVDVDPVLLDVVRAECVSAGAAGGYADAAAIQSVLTRYEVQPTSSGSAADLAVLEASRHVGALVTNDLALGRRARTLGALWLRTPDLVVLSVRAGRMQASQARRAIEALMTAGRITPALAEDYHQELA